MRPYCRHRWESDGEVERCARCAGERRRTFAGHRLTPTEARVCAYLAAHQGLQPIRRIVREAIGYSNGNPANDSTIVRTHILHIRQKLGAGVIENQYGRGYRWAGEAS